jgi:hypothetical protein
MGGAGGGDLDDVGDVGYPRDAASRDLTRGRGLREGMGGAGGGDIDDVGDIGDLDRMQAAGGFPGGTGEDIEIARELGDGSLDMPPEIPTGGQTVDDIRNTSRAGRDVIRGETGTVTGITTGVDTDDATEGPGSPWEHVGEGLRESERRGTDTPG